MGTNENSDLQLITLKNNKKSELKILNYGAAIFSFKLLDKKGNFQNVIVGPKEPATFLKADYKKENKCFGATIGRFAGRISEGKFKIGEDQVQLNQHEGVHMHGGNTGFQHKLWNIEQVNEKNDPYVILTYLSKDGEEGYPGKLKVRVKYTLSEEDKISIEYTAKTDKETIVNLTNHSYFNLNGSGSVSDHFLAIDASKILELNEEKLPTGNLKKLKDQPKDYRESRLLGNRALDDVFVLDSGENENQVQLFSPLTGIKMLMSSNQPVIVVYVPEYLPNEWEYNMDIATEFPAICFEAQNYPDAPNFKNFSSALLKPDEEYQNKIIFDFSPQ